MNKVEMCLKVVFINLRVYSIELLFLKLCELLLKNTPVLPKNIAEMLSAIFFLYLISFQINRALFLHCYYNLSIRKNNLPNQYFNCLNTIVKLSIIILSKIFGPSPASA